MKSLPTTPPCRVGSWDGLVTGQDGVKHRGRHVVVYDANNQLVCICGKWDNPSATQDAERIANLLSNQPT